MPINPAIEEKAKAFTNNTPTTETDAEFLQRSYEFAQDIYQLGVSDGVGDTMKTSALLVKEFSDELIDIAINNEPTRGCVTSNQILEAHKSFWVHTHEALRSN